MAANVRTVHATIRKPDGTPWANGRVIFTLAPGSYIPGDQFPQSTHAARTDEDGEFEIELWCNEEGEENSVYSCQLPSGESFEFTLPASASDPVELTLLRAAGVTPGMPQYQSILDYINTDERFVGPAGEPGTAGAANDTYDLCSNIAGLPYASEVVLRFVAVRAFTFPAGLTGSKLVAVTASTASKIFSVQKNGVEFGTLTFAIAGTSATPASASGATFAAGDVLTVVAPAAQDATLADLALTLKGSTS